MTETALPSHRFGEIGVSRGYLSQAQVEQCLQEQQRLRKWGLPPPIGQIFIRHRYLSFSHYVEILKEQDRCLLICRPCGKTYEIQGYREETPAACARCGQTLQKPDTARDLLIDPLQRHTPYNVQPCTMPHAETGHVVIGKYKILRETVRGFAGIVFDAYDTSRDRTVDLEVVKEGTLDLHLIVRVHREARYFQKVEHPNVVRIVDIGAEEGVHFIATEPVKGVPLSRWLADGKTPFNVGLELMDQAVQGMAAVHRAGLIHGDLQSSNIIVSPDQRAVVTNFSFGRQPEELPGADPITNPRTLHYMAPEMIRLPPAPPDARTDVWSLGVMLYEVVTGQRPFEGQSDLELQKKVLQGDPIAPRKIRPELDKDVEKIILKSLRKLRAERYPSAVEIAEALATC